MLVLVKVAIVVILFARPSRARRGPDGGRGTGDDRPRTRNGRSAAPDGPGPVLFGAKRPRGARPGPGGEKGSAGRCVRRIEPQAVFGQTSQLFGAVTGVVPCRAMKEGSDGGDRNRPASVNHGFRPPPVAPNAEPGPCDQPPATRADDAAAVQMTVMERIRRSS